MGRIAGIDGCPEGWLRLEMDANGSAPRAEIFPTAAALFGDAAEFHVLAIDIPIGLNASGPRLCDQEARRLIRPRGSSVFPAPVRAALDADSYEDACARSRAASGKALSKQAFAIIPKIREVDALLRARTDLHAKVREVHPEMCFFRLNGGPILSGKKSTEGFAARRHLIETVFPGGFESVRSRFRKKAASDDDILDAFVSLWTADRIRKNEASCVPASPPLDDYGLRMEMLA